MKKLFALLLALVFALSLAACGSGDNSNTPTGEDKTPSSSQQEPNMSDPNPVDDEPDESTNNGDSASDDMQQDGDPVDLSGFLGTKTGKFYSQFADGRMYMEYEMEMEGQKMSMISATDGSKTYSETKMDGASMGVSIIDGDTMYTIDHASKMVIKMSLGASAQTIAGAVLEESDVDMSDFKTATREIDGKTYDTEEWIVDGAASIFCFDGDDLAYMVGVFEGMEVTMKIVEVSNNVDASLFDIPEDYTLMEM